MSRAERAIIMAAGFGNRMRPLTEHTPKPLLPVGGVPMICSCIEALRYWGITEIYVVVGYLKEQFRPLEDRYPGLQLIENPDYASANNISSLFYAREHLDNVIIMDGDQVIRDRSILCPDFERSGYCCIRREEPTDEWVLMLNGGGVVAACSRDGAPSGWELHSISFWSHEDGARLRKHLEQEYLDKQNRGIYWDDVALFCYPECYQLGIRPISPESTFELDGYEEYMSCLAREG